MPLEQDHDTAKPRTLDPNLQPPTSNFRFLINRVLIVLAVGAILAGLYSDQWRIVLRNAILL